MQVLKLKLEPKNASTETQISKLPGHSFKFLQSPRNGCAGAKLPAAPPRRQHAAAAVHQDPPVLHGSSLLLRTARAACRYARAKECGDTRRTPRQRAPGRARAPEFHGAAQRVAAAAAGAPRTCSDQKLNTMYLTSVD